MAPTACNAVAVGAVAPGIVVLRTGTAAVRAIATTTWASAWPLCQFNKSALPDLSDLSDFAFSVQNPQSAKMRDICIIFLNPI